MSSRSTTKPSAGSLRPATEAIYPRYALNHCTLYTGRGVLQNHALVIDGSRILDLIPEGQLPSDLPRIDGQGWAVAPGFIDLQLNGCGGVMFNDAITADTLETMHRTNLQSGTTSFLPTLITTSDQDMDDAMALVAKYRQQQPYHVLGLHLEGPYLNAKRGGIHSQAFIRSADRAMIDRIVKAGPEVVKLVTLAPEVVSSEYIRQLAAAGILVSAGHSEASFEEALVGFEAGVGMVTHLFNAMSGWQGRSPGLVGAVLSEADVYAGVIADGHHVHYSSVGLAHRVKQDHLVLVTDATPPVGTTLKSFIIGGQEVFYRDGKCVSADGTLGGAALTLIAAIENCVGHVGIPLAEALRMATLYPARAIGADRYLGMLSPGYQANIALFDADTFIVKGVIDQGMLAWSTTDLG
ncbi:MULTISPECIES: N-acetylglucosamine-6-phosphate deacetylase [Cyanophyceae]|uniref:N-acetylglucosamine-6-phosphate deacetylase n=1 Tax=Cyanophyceae TaxID=3028117 RepID=UPI0016885DC4|nr:MULTISPECIES: N-acetylglucosamine-6-phosphate deacetylase [Cyanophyceae]MBD1917160.1 N-acetylglucosamine-6-phosphate deacetylase [Phormidium sp. FACHB-77]MBD2030691.1 N-acetylglucosamine-6-phosphate deacetylase [Phormidium sp. FACHB-322]MBD2050201.1 N-acetylglucosamine-6-phosphate deacetylase [Leptolyngbya sp. FACHB-60]